MTKEEEIREGIEKPIDLLFKKENCGYSQRELDICVEQIRRNLHSQGGMIKVKELPSIYDGKGDIMTALEYKNKLDACLELLIKEE